MHVLIIAIFHSQSLPFKTIKHIITGQDFQPTVDSCIFIMVFGQLKVCWNILAQSEFNSVWFSLGSLVSLSLTLTWLAGY